MNRERFKKILDEYYSHSPPTKFVLIINTCRHTAVAEMIAERWCRHYGIEWDYWNENDPARIARWGDCRKIACNMSIDDTDYNFNMEDFVE